MHEWGEHWSLEWRPIVVWIYAIILYAVDGFNYVLVWARDVLLPTSLRPQRRVRLVWRAIYRVHVNFIGHSRFVQFRIYLFAAQQLECARASQIRVRIEVLREYVFFFFSIPLWIPIATIRSSQFPLCEHTVSTCSCPKRIVETTIMAIIRSEK